LHPLKIVVVDITPELAPSLVHFLDQAVGKNYYQEKDIFEICKKSQKNGVNCSLALVDESGEVLGARITYPPGNWSKGRGQGLSPHLWKTKMEETAYFQSLFIAEKLTGMGWGPKLSLLSIDRLKKIGAKAVVCHSWIDSPNQTSQRYLKKLGFEPLVKYPLYWSKVDYNCTVCLKPPCQCTAEECILYL
jgi:ribosomal protein S18 acetylase RimI-like enzyme